MEVLHSLQGHLLSGEQWMKMIEKISIDDSGFSITAHNWCIHKRTDAEVAILISRQVDDILIGTTDKAIAERITERIGKRVKFQHEENLPITFLGLLVEDCDGVDIKQFNDSILMSSKGNIERMLKSHGWDKEFPENPKSCKDGETEGHLVSLCQQNVSLGSAKKKDSKKALWSTASLKRKWDHNARLHGES